MMRTAILILASLLAFGATAESEQSISERVGSLKEPVPARTTMGRVHEVDYGKRQATIGGYVYDFGPPGLPIKVTLKNGGAGTFELLTPGMQVKVTYGELDTARLAVIVEEVGDDEFEEY